MTSAAAPRHIGLFRALFLGDLLCATPAMRALRAAWPKARITLIGLPWARALIKRIPYVDDFIAFSGDPRLPDTVSAGTAAATQSWPPFDCVFQMHGSGEASNAITAAMSGHHLYGYHRGPVSHTPTATLLPWDDQQHEVERYLALAETAGAARRGTALTLRVHERDHEQAAALLKSRKAPAEGYVCIHAGARLPSRRWPAERFGAVADALARSGYMLVLTGSTQEQPLAAAVAAAMSHPAVDLTGATTLGTLAAVVQRADLVVSNDTGMSHVAAAVGTRSVVIASGSDVNRWRPLDGQRHRVLWRDMPCRPCAHDVCPVGHPCALGISPDEVIMHAHDLLQRYHHAA